MIEQLRSYHNFYHFSEEVTSTQRPEREALEEDHPRQGKPLVPRQTLVCSGNESLASVAGAERAESGGGINKVLTCIPGLRNLHTGLTSLSHVLCLVWGHVKEVVAGPEQRAQGLRQF